MRVAHRLAGLNAEQDFLRVRVGVPEVVAIVRGDQGDAGLARQTDDFGVDALFDFEPLVLNFEEEIVLSENVAQAVRCFASLVRFLVNQIFGDCAAQARRQCDQASAVFRQQVVVDPRLVIETFEESGGDELDQVAVAFAVFAKKNQMIIAALARFRGAVRRVALRRFAAIVAAALGHVHFAADDGFDSARFGRVIERFRREKISVVGDGHGRHLAARRFLDNFLEVARSIQ
jgi:hypothetical protein